ncbi:MAG: RecX family transcriptional regulator [Candidatus Symbiothrix sp.]|jgi:regulatory protein|nr:RecX family transcriptional regulator [Candidatus Symbiothrix sp.]
MENEKIIKSSKGVARNTPTYEQALHRLAALCSRKEQCVSDIRTKMDAWELVPAEQEKLLQHLQQEKFLDEQRFCAAFVHDKSLYSHWGVHKIRYELKKKQLPDNLISEALGKLNPEETIHRLRQLLTVKRKTVKGKTDYEIRLKLMRYACGKGFSPEEVEKALD